VEAVRYIQSIAVFEIVHAFFGWTGSLATTIVQVFSRLLIVWFISFANSPSYTSMLVAWSVTECVRYAFYTTSLLGIESRVLLWLRYTLFFVLYPLGASSEAIEIYNKGGYWSLFLALYPYGFYTMYTHMIKQRAKVLGAPKMDSPPKTELQRLSRRSKK
jgi:very-long-chain (3R)-3-hydroxyacyl-CoA dehydratase